MCRAYSEWMRRRSLLPLVLTALAVASGCDLDSSNESAKDERLPAAEEKPSGRPSAQLVERLRGGGYVLVFRHAATDTGMDTTDDLTDCSRQRNLSAEGRRQSRTIGRAFRSLGISVDRVLASPFCRTRDTARLAFGRLRATRALLSPEFFAEASEEGRRRGLRRLLTVRPRRKSNTVLISHGSAIFDATGLNPDEGDAVVARPRPGPRGFRVVSTIKVDEWAPRAPR
jgi:phosphohistidine phosphatase SixA